MSQYFTLFQLEERFDIDVSTLEQTYHALASRFHPDKFAAASTFDQKQAMMMASTINEAYRILRNPTDRAAYLLQQKGIDADAPEHTSYAPEFLMQQMEWREALEEARAEKNQTRLNDLQTEIATAQQKLYNLLKTAFIEEQYDDAAKYVRQSRFLDKLYNEIQIALS